MPRARPVCLGRSLLRIWSESLTAVIRSVGPSEVFMSLRLLVTSLEIAPMRWEEGRIYCWENLSGLRNQSPELGAFGWHELLAY